jgi:hypothetical protein
LDPKVHCLAPPGSETIEDEQLVISYQGVSDQMRKIGLLLLATATALVLAVGSGSAVAANAQANCEAAGGMYVKDPPENRCVFPGTPVGNSGNVKDAGEESTRGQSGPHEVAEECQMTNPSGTHNCTTS